HEGKPGFLAVDHDRIWPTDPADVHDRLPEDWLEETKSGVQVKSRKGDLLPTLVRVGLDGAFLPDDAPVTLMWWTPAPFQLCLRCGVAYDRIGEFAKLTTLGSEGRSTATTVLSLSAVRQLRADATLERRARKLLSFTDNRQDAALQAGHFNDFVQTAMLRAALAKAVATAGPDGLAHDQVVPAVFRELDLPFDAYAIDPEVEFGARRQVESTFRDVLAYRLYRDLQRGWRVTAPNLEQCGLLRLDYLDLDEVCASDRLWATRHPALAGASRAERERVARVLLDYLRRELAIKVDALDPMAQEALQQRADQRLAGPWSLDGISRLEHARTVVPRSQKAKDYRGWSYLSARSGFGRFLRRATTFPSHAVRLTLDDTATVITDLFDALRRGGLVEEVEKTRDGVPAYQVPAAALVWRPGDGSVPVDPIRMPTGPASPPPPNVFFTDLYSSDTGSLAGLLAREHTAQVRADDREDRERRFREAELPVLYCSPTMELGVDIADLNVVSLRNMPPTPANYAQRSGRAGRQGQPALVFTYCAAGSPHDQWFFHRPDLMIAGQVAPPRLELANEDLLRAHVHAVWLAHSGMDLGRSLKEVLDLDRPGLPLLDRVADAFAEPTARARALEVAGRLLDDLEPLLQRAPWWHADWLAGVLNAITLAFEQACQRWRGLYRAAMTQFDAQNRIIADASAAPAAKEDAKRRRREAETQLSLLTAAEEEQSQSDFYSYRYFASEGFLPGYSFPRLPLSAFIPGSRTKRVDSEYVSRPRFLAISEFGPRSLVYHDGNRYEITKVILAPGELDEAGDPIVTTNAKRCERCGYLHPQANADVCDSCGVLLPPTTQDLFRMENVSTKRRERINADEEERQRQGFEVITGYRYAERNGRLSRRTGTVHAADGTTLATLTYGDTATLWRINLGLRRRKDLAKVGFPLGIRTGEWGRDENLLDGDGDTPASNEVFKRVVPFVEDTRNCLVVDWAEVLTDGQLASLQEALKQAIQFTFQLEEDELAAEPLPSRRRRRALLFFESSEGGAGVLRRLVDEPGALATVAAKALELCHFDAAGIDIAPPGDDRCEAACYDCILSYRNQLDHQLLDRRELPGLLVALATAAVSAAPGAATAEEHLAELKQACDSGLEREFLDRLWRNGNRLPDRAPVTITDARTQPDFVYDEQGVAVYVDGPIHRYPDRHDRDRVQTADLEALGWQVVRFSAEDDWAAKLTEWSWLFGGDR
ncbi:MAG: helicase-related protein, partial [Acidimicrobiales bacterium]